MAQASGRSSSHDANFVVRDKNRITGRITKIRLKSYHEKRRCKFLSYSGLSSGRYWT